MTFDERLAALGVDLSDLPKTYKDAHTWNAFTAAFALDVMADEKRGEEILAAFVLHLNDIIDRMETRIINLTVEREYLLYRMWGEYPCVICENAKREGGCAVDICEFEFAGVSEDWRAHDD